ncbi:MAG TPA: SdpI family protein [Gemmatimonadaceae bacterium]|nr:SdpI family protein [Gemmatimonadaceae bacterium]
MRKWYPAIILAGAFLFSAIVYARLPAAMITHWGLYGEPNGYSSRPVGAFVLPAMGLAIWGLMRGLPLIDPRRANYAKFQGTYDLVINLAVTLLVVVHIATLGRALGWPLPDALRTSAAVVGVVTLILGNVLPRARSNWWFGIRTPWTLSSDTVWTRTQRVGGYLFTAAGLITLLSALLPPVASFILLIASVGVASLGSVVYSYVVWREEQP